MNRKSIFSRKFGGVAVINLMALSMVYVLFGNSLLQARVSISGGSAGEESTRKPTVQERILEVPNGTMIEVRLLDNQKLRGRLGEVNSEGFTLQTAQGSKIEAQKVAFTEMKSFKQLENTTGKKVGKGMIYALAGAGVLFVVLFIVALSTYGGS